MANFELYGVNGKHFKMLLMVFHGFPHGENGIQTGVHVLLFPNQEMHSFDASSFSSKDFLGMGKRNGMEQSHWDMML